MPWLAWGYRFKSCTAHKKVQESQWFPDFFIFAKINLVSNVLVVAI